MADTTNLGYQMPYSPFIQNKGVTWDPAYQNAQGGSAAQQWANQTGMSAGQYPGLAQQNLGPGGTPSAPGIQSSGTGYSIQDLINKQMTENASAKAQNQANWQGAKTDLQGVIPQYNGMSAVQGSQSLTNQLLKNPEALNDATVGRIQNQNANQIQSQTENQLRQQQGILAADGQNDASTMAAVAERLGRQGMAAQQTASTNLQVQRANQRNADMTGAAQLGQRQAAQDISVPQGVNTTIMQNLPQYRPDDYSGLLALSQQAQFGNALLQNQKPAAGSPGNPFGNTQTPIAQNPIGGKYNQSNNSTNAGFGFQNQPEQPQSNKWMQQPQMVATW